MVLNGQFVGKIFYNHIVIYSVSSNKLTAHNIAHIFNFISQQLKIYVLYF